MNDKGEALTTHIEDYFLFQWVSLYTGQNLINLYEQSGEALHGAKIYKDAIAVSRDPGSLEVVRSSSKASQVEFR